MLTLDCSSRTQTLLTLSAGFSCKVHELEEVLLSLDLEQIYESDPAINVDSNCYLREYVCGMLGEPRPFTSAYWFHGTRTFSGNTFPGGLLSLDKSESVVMDMLIKLAPDQNISGKMQAWNKKMGVPDSMFQLRTADRTHWDPYGHLIREVHFHANELGLGDYARLPELVEDVLNAYNEEYQCDLTEHYLRVLHPCLVWFLAKIDNKENTLETALSYAYTSVRRLPPGHGTTSGIDCNGLSVPSEHVIKVEFLK